MGTAATLVSIEAPTLSKACGATHAGMVVTHNDISVRVETGRVEGLIISTTLSRASSGTAGIDTARISGTVVLTNQSPTASVISLANVGTSGAIRLIVSAQSLAAAPVVHGTRIYTTRVVSSVVLTKKLSTASIIYPTNICTGGVVSLIIGAKKLSASTIVHRTNIHTAYLSIGVSAQSVAATTISGITAIYTVGHASLVIGTG